jgi:hypothetical protein
MLKYRYTVILVVLLIPVSCINRTNKIPKEILDYAGSNRGELEKVISHYKNEPMKLEAAMFLIKNMPYHYYTEEYFMSPQGEKYRPNIAHFKNKEEVESHCDSLLRNGFNRRSNKMPDITSINSEYLINNIDLAFQVWEKPWAKKVPFDDFCRYILPYRAQIEKPSTLRREIMERFLPVLDSLEVTTPLEACIIINERLKSIIKYKQTGFPFYPAIDETYAAGYSQCEGMCNLGTYIMRALGIPVTVDMTTWVKMDLGHSWCAVLDDGKFYSFGPGEEQPIEHAKYFSKRRYRRPAKVYRSRFDRIKNEKIINDDGFRTYLKNPLLYDVTHEYGEEVIRIQITADIPDVSKNDQVYLCTYNYYGWKPLAIGKYSDGLCIFNNVVGDNIFMVAHCPDKRILKFVTAPFYVNKKGDIHKFIPDKQSKISYSLSKKNKTAAYTLFYWDIDEQHFIPLDYEKSTEESQYYTNIPENSLLWFKIPERIYNQRVFYIHNDSIRIY